MNSLLTFAFIGGDGRQTYTISQLAAEGYHIRVLGFDKYDGGFSKNVRCFENLHTCLKGADVVVLPMPYSTDGMIVNMPLAERKVPITELSDVISEGLVVFAGKVDDKLKRLCKACNAKAVDYSTREELAVLNAIPTAEGAIAAAMDNTPYTIHNSRCLITGYGRIGKILSAKLKALGAEVTVSARKHSDLAMIEASGCAGIRTEKLAEGVGEFDIIFNTIPYKVFDFKVLSKTKKDVLIIDLASRPGGVDFDVANELSRDVLWALSLPGKAAPKTAGEIIKNTIMNILEEMSD